MPVETKCLAKESSSENTLAAVFAAMTWLAHSSSESTAGSLVTREGAAGASVEVCSRVSAAATIAFAYESSSSEAEADSAGAASACKTLTYVEGTLPEVTPSCKVHQFAVSRVTTRSNWPL